MCCTLRFQHEIIFRSERRASALLFTYYFPQNPFVCLFTDLLFNRSTTFAFIMFPLITLVLLFLSYALLIACDNALHARGACSSSYTVCKPKGAATTNEPPIGTGISSLFVDVVDTLDSVNLAKREAGRDRGTVETRASGGSLCCKYLTSMTLLVGTDVQWRCRRNHMSASPGFRAFLLLCEHRHTQSLALQTLICDC